MRKKRIHSQKINSQRIAFYFIVGLSTLFLVSVLARIGIVLSKSAFDGVHRFTVLIHSKQKQQAILSLDPTNNVLSVVNLPSGPAVIPTSRYLEIPIDRNIMLTSKEDLESINALMSMKNDLTGKDVFLVFAKLLPNFTTFKTDMTILDFIRFAWIGKSIPKSSVKYVTLESNLSENSVDRLSLEFFPDLEIQKENYSIQVINATGINGLGNRLGRFITNMGGTVVSVTSREQEEKSSKIIQRFEKDSYTKKRLKTILGFSDQVSLAVTPTPIEKLLLEETSVELPHSENFVSDIIIIIGKDRVTSIPF